MGYGRDRMFRKHFLQARHVWVPELAHLDHSARFQELSPGFARAGPSVPMRFRDSNHG